MREQRLQRNLKIVIAVLGLMIFAGLAAIAFKIISTAMHPTGSGVSSRTLTATGTDSAVSFELPKGAKIVSISLSGNRLAIQHDGPSGAGITVLDADTGRRVLELKPTEAVPRN